MDIEKLVERGHDEVDEVTRCILSRAQCERIARAVLAIALAAAAEEADAERKDWVANNCPHEALGALSTRKRLRTLATQLGAANG